MAKEKKQKKQRGPKEPGRIAQMIQVYRQTRVHDRTLTPLILLSLLGPIAIAVVVAWITSNGVVGWILWVVTGVLSGVLIAMILLGRRAEKVAYRQISGRAGAVGAVIQNALRRSWRGSETPVAMNPRTQDAVYRVVGKGGVVIISEGPKTRTQRLRNDEERKVKRILPTVQITHLQVGPDDDSVLLEDLSRKLLKIKKVLSKQEVVAVHNRLVSLQTAPGGIPKGIDPMKVRAPRPR